MCLPVLAPAQAFVRAGERRGKMRNAEFGIEVRGWMCLAMRFCRDALPLARVRPLRFCCDALPLAYVQRCVSVAALCPYARSAMHFCRGALPLARARRCSSVVTFCIGARSAMRLWRGTYPRLTPAVCRMATNRTACDMLRSYPAGRDRHLCVLDASARLSAFVGSLRVWAFLAGDLDGVPGTGLPGTRGTGLAAPRLYAFAQPHWRCESFHGEYAGAKCGSRTAAAPDCAKESSTLWTLFTLRRGCVGTYSRPLCVFAQSHWRCESFRGEYAGAKCGSRTAAAPKPAPKSRMWKPHCGCPQTCAKESNVEAALPPRWTLVTLRRGWVGADSHRRRPGTIGDPPGSELWPGGSCCIEMLPIRSNIQTRAALKRRRVGLTRAKRRGSRHCRPPSSGEESG